MNHPAPKSNNAFSAVAMLATILLLAASASAQQTVTEKVVEAQLGSTVNVHRCGPLFTSGQFQTSDIATLKQNGVKEVITLRTEGEISWDEKAEVEKAGIAFQSVPISGPEALSDDTFDTIREMLKKQNGKQLLHCGGAMRVAAVWLPYRVLDQGVALETAKDEAKEIGLSSPAFEKKAVDYINRKLEESKSKPSGEASVKPGINSNFLDPELNVDQFVKRFEVESREIYTARNAIVAGCKIKSGMKIADVGAGTGLFSRIFSERVGQTGWVYSVDISPRFLEHINKEAKSAQQTNFTGVLCAENDVRLPPDSVDLVFVCDTYHHFEFPKSTMASIHRALKQGGRLVMIDFERIPGKTREWLMNHVRAGKEVFRAEIQDSGFTLIEEKKIAGLIENYFLVFKKN